VVTATLADLTALVPDWAAETAFWRRLCAEARAEGYEAGFRDGYEHGARLLEDEWPAIVAPVLRNRPDHAELERRRWGPGGREHFGDPRPGDFQGRHRHG
jgi:hypothetical protein